MPVVAVAFANPTRRSEHYDKHYWEVVATSEIDYEDKARVFLDTPLADDADIEERSRNNTDLVRYNKRTREFAIMTVTGIIRTYYKPMRHCDVPLGYPFNTHKFPTNYDYFIHESQKK